MSDLFPLSSPPLGVPAGSTSGIGDKRTQKDQPRIRRRNRLITSCLECRRRKLKCDKQHPCTNCTKFSRSCLFIAPALDPAGQAKLAEVKEKMGMLERTLEQDVARRNSNASVSNSRLINAPPFPGQEESLSDQEEDEDVKDLEPCALAVEDCAYYEDEGNDELVDLGIAMGRVRITERIGGFVRPRFSEEVCFRRYRHEILYSPFSSSLKPSRACPKTRPAKTTTTRSRNNPKTNGWPQDAITLHHRPAFSSLLELRKPPF